MNIIILGVDNAGKTTLAKDLSEIYSLDFVVSPGPLKNNEVIQDRIDFLRDNLEKGNKVFDRFYIFDDSVYGPVIRKDPGPTAMAKEESVEFLKELTQEYSDTVFIYCRPSVNTIVNTLDDRPQMNGVKDNIHDLITYYDMLIFILRQYTFEPYNINCFDYDYNNRDDYLAIRNYLDKIKGGVK